MIRCSMGSMLAGVLLLLELSASPFLFAAPAAQARGNSAGQVPNAACTLGSRTLDGPLSDLSFEKLADGSKLIVEAFVQSVEPGAAQGRPNESDALLIPVRVLKGPDTLGQFAVAQSRSADFFEMQPGQHFILFLNELNPTVAQRFPERPGVARYGVVELAKLCVDAGKIRVSTSRRPDLDFLRARFEGAELEKAVADIRDYGRLLRVSGRIVAEGGIFPLAGSRWTVPSTDFDQRSSLKLVLTPADPVDVRPGGSPRLTVAVYAPPATLQNTSSDSLTRLLSIDRNGAFSLSLDSGAYRVTIDGLPFGHYLKSISYGSHDLLQEPLRIDGTVSAAVLVTLTRKVLDAAPAGVRVSGHVTGIPAGLALDRLWVVMISDAIQNVRTGVTQPARDGTFEFLNVPPGSYMVKTFQNIPAPLGTAWGVPSTASVVVSNRDVPVEMPLFAGTEVTARVVDKNGNSRSAGSAGPRLRFTPVGGGPGPPITLIPALDGTFRLWLPRGEFRVSSLVPAFNVTYSVKGLSSGSVDLLQTPLKIDGVSMVEPILIKVE